MPKQITINDEVHTFEDDYAYRQWLEKHDYSFLQLIPVDNRNNGHKIKFAISIDDLDEKNTDIKYVPVKRPIHNARIGLDSSTVKDAQSLCMEIHKKGCQDANQAYQYIKNDMNEFISAVRNEMYDVGNQIQNKLEQTGHQIHDYIKRDVENSYHHGMQDVTSAYDRGLTDITLLTKHVKHEIEKILCHVVYIRR